MAKESQNLLTFGGHLEVLRQMLFRIIWVSGVLAIVVFCFKDMTWRLLLAPSEWDFITYRWIEKVIQSIGFYDFHLEKLILTFPYSIPLLFQMRHVEVQRLGF